MARSSVEEIEIMLTGYDDFIAELSRQTLLEELQDKLPTERKIEHGLNMITKKK